MARLGLRSRVLAYLLVFIAVLLLILWLFQIVFLDDFYRSLKTDMLNSSALILESNINNVDIQALAERVGQENDVCILLLSAQGTTMVSHDANMFCVLHHLEKNELRRYRETAQKKAGTLIETFELGGERSPRYEQNRFVGRVPAAVAPTYKSMLYVHQVPLADGSEATLFLNAMITPVNATVDTLTEQLIIITMILLTLALVLAMVISHRIVQPLVDTTKAAQQLAKARYQPPASGSNYNEIRVLNETLLKAAHELSKVETLQHELIANISHDLRTPLTMISGYAEMMRDMPNEITPENLQIMVDETNRLSTLVSAVMDYSRLQSNPQPAQRIEFDLTASIHSLMNRYISMLAPESYQVTFDYSEKAIVCGDETQITQVICNLINNALTYTGDDKRVAVTQYIEDGWVTLSISDSGDGIPQEELPLIWNRYYRVKENHKRAVIGSGLGLSIVQNILESHQAPYGVESEVGKGTRFWFQLPLCTVSE